MNKELRKTVETELATRVKEVLDKHHPAATAEISKQIREGVKFIAKKFVKHLPSATEKKETVSKKQSAAPKKNKAASTAKKKSAKPAAKKASPAKKKTAVKVKSKSKRK